MPSNPLTDPNWAPDLADTIDRFATSIRTKATDKVVVVVRAVVFGIVIFLAAIAAFVLALILGTQLLEEAVARIFRAGHDSAVWTTYMIFGGVFLLAGMWAMRHRHSKADA